MPMRGRRKKPRPKLKDDKKLLFILGLSIALMAAFFIFITAR